MPGAWWDAQWSVSEGCTPVSEGCSACWAAQIASRFHPAYPGLAQGGKWTGAIALHTERLGQPARWRNPRAVFVSPTGDLFHPDVPDTFIGRVFEHIAKAPRHIFLILTKRAARMRAWSESVCHYQGGDETTRPLRGWPHNAWIGVTVETQARAAERLPDLLATPATHRWVSVEPALGPVNLHPWLCRSGAAAKPEQRYANICEPSGGLSWLVVGCESGRDARPMDLDWTRSIRDQCAAAGVPWMLKQAHVGGRLEHMPALDGVRYDARPGQ